MHSEVMGYLDRTIDTIKSLLRPQLTACKSDASQPCSVSGYAESIPRGLARFKALTRARIAIRHEPTDRQIERCRREAAHYSEGGLWWSAITGDDRTSKLRREGCAAAGEDLAAIVALSEQGPAA